MIRIAGIADYEVVYKMALEFIRTTAYADIFDEPTLNAIVVQFLEETTLNRVILLDSEGRGMLAGARVPFIFGQHSNATEVGWWVYPEHRKSGLGIELLQAFEYWAQQAGCRFVTMISLDNALGKFYEKQGYSLMERTYMKDLNTWQRSPQQ